MITSLMQCSTSYYTQMTEYYIHTHQYTEKHVFEAKQQQKNLFFSYS